MKKNILWLLFILLPLFLGGCNNDEEIVFDHERPQFELREGQILLEVIMPQSTAADDEIFISGDFNGGDSLAMLNSKWQLIKAENSDIKWAIYINPSDLNGYNLADGYHFVSKAEGTERTVFNEEAIHTENPGINARVNVWVNRWASYFEVDEEPEEPVHDGYAVYVEDNTGWDVTTIYVWGDAEIFGGWPGAQPTGTQLINGITYKYYDFSEANTGKSANLIFNNNGGGNQFDGVQGFIVNRDLYLRITSSGYEEIVVEPEITHDGYAIFIEDNTGWDAITMYAWNGDGLPELFGGWPGILPTGEATINGVKYKYFDTGKANEGTVYNLILNNNNGGNQLDLANVTLNRDYYFTCSSFGGTEISLSTNK
ncbi:starch-binding protein [uncultured Bacteroides sp.]|uniref:starch-binding protein n=1 Tax=uncultured Bacteroides sp. TaxID=162156 RepID=UPI00280B2B2C|nr:starch-binding protein [uncultured Bacteroides sp.]